jgi:hypothetical protein
LVEQSTDGIERGAGMSLCGINAAYMVNHQRRGQFPKYWRQRWQLLRVYEDLNMPTELRRLARQRSEHVRRGNSPRLCKNEAYTQSTDRSRSQLVQFGV